MPYANREERNAYMREYRKRRMESDPAFVESERQRAAAYAKKNADRIAAKRKARYDADPEPQRQRAREEYRSLRSEFLQEYGGQCACCGEDEEAFLALDHIGGGGGAERAQTGGRNVGVLRKMKKEEWPKDRYRILCANCNTATTRGRTCPHQVNNKENK